MQSTRRKRDRAEHDDEGASAAASSRTRRSRGAAHKRLHAQQAGDNNKNGTSISVDEDLAMSEKSVVRQGSTASNSETQRINNENFANDDAEHRNKELSTSMESNSGSEDTGSKEGQRHGIQSGNQQDKLSEVNTADGANGDGREKQIAALLSHRRAVLDRIKKCRAAAQTRLGETQDEHGSAVNVVDVESGKSSDEEEIAAFLELSRSAIHAAKKQRSDATSEGPPQQNRAPISLRRGSSVGKRMSIALSSLAKNAVGVPPSSTGESETLPLHEQIAQSSSSISAAEGVVSSKSRGGSTVHPLGSSAQVSKSTSNKQCSAPASVASLQGAQRVRAGAGSAASQKIKRSGSQKNVKSYGHKSRGSVTTTSEHQASMQPLHAGIGGNSLPTNLLAQPSAVYPESMALRERRNSIRSRLASLLYERQKRIEEGETKPLSSRQNFPTTFQLNRQDKARPTSFASVAAKQRGPGEPPLLPRRRKTQWDYLLEEMRWLATDFIEERKWKASCARTMSSAVVAVGRTCISPMKAYPPETAHTVNGKQAPVDRGKKSVECEAKPNEDRHANVDARKGRVAGRQYVPATSSDIKSSREVSTIMSDMIAELWDVSVDAGAMAAPDASKDASLKRHLKLRQKLRKENSLGSNVGADEIGGRSTVNDSSAMPKSGCGARSEDGNDDSQGDSKSGSRRIQPEELSYEQISARLEVYIQSAETRMDTEDLQEGGSDDMAPSHVAASDFIEWLWGDNALGGAILDGPSGSGKTTTACSLLWKCRDGGPQLIICPPARLFRWRHELAKLRDLRVRTLGLSCGISGPELASNDSSTYELGDVVLCELSSTLIIDGGLDVSAFSTIILDCRFQSATTFGTGDPSGVDRSPVPKELVSHSWWLSLLDSLAAMQSRRLLIETYGHRSNQDESMFGCSYLEDRQGVESLASKMAFLVGPALFYSKRRACTKKVLSWTKRRVNIEVESGVNASEKLMEMKRFLFQVMKKFSFSLHATPGKRKFEWRSHMCELSKQQRTEYDRCCFEVRGALSFGGVENGLSGDSPDECRVAAVRALLRLRQVCFHPRMQNLVSRHFGSSSSILAHSLSKNETTEPPDVPVWGRGCFNRVVSKSSSQPDISLALEILRSSAKLRELLMILRTEGGYHIQGDDVIGAEIENVRLPKKKENKGVRASVTCRKVVILASLPEAQLVTSLLLNAVGITHELLMRSPSSRDRLLIPLSSRHQDRSTSLTVHPAPVLSWIECQHALARFNTSMGQSLSKDESQTRNSSVNVVVASPVSVAHLSGGVGVSSADLIVLLDEDWSGRSERISMSIVTSSQRKPRAGSKRKDAECDCIRLICRNTCEEKFLLSEGGKSHATDPAWPMDAFGYLSLPRSNNFAADIRNAADGHPIRSASQGIFSFPGTNISTFQDSDLSLVLCSDDLPPDFATGTQASFLPADALQGSCQASEYASFVQSLIDFEAASCPLTTKQDSVCQAGDGEPDIRYFAIAPPLAADMPPMVVTRRDVLSLSSRLYIEMFGKSFVLDSLGSVSAAPSNLLPVQPENSFLMGPSDENTELVDVWHKSGLSSNPDDLAKSLLVYDYANVDGMPPTAGLSGSQSDETSVAAAMSSVSTDCRRNTYSLSFSLSRTGQYTAIRDGNQGCEPKVYFPPLFPTLQLGCDLAKADILGLNHLGLHRSSLKNESSTGRLSSAVTARDGESGKKRKAAASEAPRSGKRPRIQHASQVATSDLMGETSTEASGQVQTLSSPQGTTSSVPNSESDASRLVGATDTSGVDAVHSLHRKEDFGLVGIGALAHPSASALASAMESVDVSTYTDWKDQFESNTADQDYFSHGLVCDSEEAGTLTTRSSENAQLDAMLLFVAKKSLVAWIPGGAQYLPTAKAGVGGTQGSMAAWASSANAGTVTGSLSAAVIGNGGLNGSASSKKKKKVHQNTVSTGASAFSRIPHAGFSGGSQPMNNYAASGARARDGSKSKIISRQRRQGLSLFDYSSFRLAFVRLRNRVSDRVAQSSLEWSESSGVGTGVPLILLKGDTSLAQQLSQGVQGYGTSVGGWTGIVTQASSDGERVEAKTATVADWSSPNRSVEAPSRVDFGPFQAGYLSSSSALTAVTPPSPRVGVSLPMGVKIPFHRREQQASPWTTDEDDVLRKCVSRFGPNFQLAAFLVSKDAISAPTSFSDEEITRSARQCRERWSYLTSSQPSLAKDVQQLEQSFMAKGFMNPDQIVHSFHSVTQQSLLLSQAETAADQANLISARFGSEDVLLPSHCVFERGDALSTTQESAEDKDESGDVVMKESTNDGSEPTVSKTKRSFIAYRGAALLKQEVPLAIPGSTSSDTAVPALVASHPSHMQSVQAAVSRSPTASSRDMWPLQMLGIADKQRGMMSGRTASQGSAAASSPSRSPGSAQQGARSNGPPTPQSNSTARQQQSASSPYK